LDELTHVRRLRQLTTRAEFGELALRSEDLDEVLTEACRLVGRALGTDLAKVMELQEDGKTLRVRAGVGWKPGVVGAVTLMVTDETSEGHALRTGEPMVSPDIETETRFKYPQFLIDNGVRAVANVIILGGHGKPPFGILQVDSREPRQFNDDDIDFLRNYANLLAGAVARKQAETDLLRANQLLEERVAERTKALVSEADERKRIEGELRQSNKMEAVGQLTGGLAHDFNNLLQGISGNLERIRIRADQGRTGELGRFIDSAMGSTERAASLTQRLLAFSRRQPLEPQVIDVNELIRSMEDVFRRTVGPFVEVKIDLMDDLWLTLCDPNQLESSLLNLVINARDAMPDGGQFTVETANVVLPDLAIAPRDVGPVGLPSGGYVAVFVTDTGTGMTPKITASAFDPFFTTKPVGQGTGLGLSMVNGFVHQSGGSVTLQSKVGQGTRVGIYLPRPHGSGLISAVLLKPVIMLVEDDQSVRTAIIDALSDLNCTVLEALNARLAIDIMDTSARIDLLVTDIALNGGLNGRQLAEAARRRRPSLKVLFITGYASNTVDGQGTALPPGTELISKPFSLAVLAAKVQSMIALNESTQSVQPTTPQTP
jgi:signal transduction histidine kinase/ActR/RegA family two-component response regulator